MPKCKRLKVSGTVGSSITKTSVRRVEKSHLHIAVEYLSRAFYLQTFWYSLKKFSICSAFIVFEGGLAKSRVQEPLNHRRSLEGSLSPPNFSD